MKDFDRFSKEFFMATKDFSISGVLTRYQLPNSDELHNMICGYVGFSEFGDARLFDEAESIDYLKYEKELWNLKKPKQ